jgi:acyl-CoA thioesterase FadM
MSMLRRTILTRGYELDGRGRASLGTVARYFEVVRWEAIRQEGSPLRDVFRDGGRLVMRAQYVELLTAIRSLEELTLEVEVARVGGSSIHFLSRLLRGGELAALNQSVVVAIGADKLPKRAPDSVRASATGATLRELPQLLEPPSEPAFSSRAYVRPSDLDSLDHVNHSRYIDYADDAYQHARAHDAYGAAVPDGGHAVLIEYERETKLSTELLAERHLIMHTWPTAHSAFGFELVDPVDGKRVSRAMIEASHEAASRFAGLAPRV